MGLCCLDMAGAVLLLVIPGLFVPADRGVPVVLHIETAAEAEEGIPVLPHPVEVHARGGILLHQALGQEGT